VVSLKILNLFCGIGGNRKHWEGHEVHSVDNQENILDAYKELFPDDVTILDDAYNYLLENYNEYDFIWASPPCQSHSRFIRSGRNRKPRFPDLRLYEVILFLQHNFKGKWVVENVIPYYKPLIPGKIIGRHIFWTNFIISDFKDIKQPKDFINLCNVDGSKKLKKWLGLNYTGNLYYGKNHDPSQILRNCVHPQVGKHIIECAKLNKPKVTECDLSQNNKKEVRHSSHD